MRYVVGRALGLWWAWLGVVLNPMWASRHVVTQPMPTCMCAVPGCSQWPYRRSMNEVVCMGWLEDADCVEL